MQLTAERNGGFSFFTEAQRRGLESESRIARVLKDLPYVISAYRSVRNGAVDRSGVDVLVLFNPAEPLASHEGVGVQVKSSNRGVEHFLKEVSAKHQLTPDQLPVWLRNNRLIILSGRWTRRRIKDSFAMQLQAISDFFSDPSSS